MTSFPNPDYTATGAKPTSPLPASIYTTPVPASPTLASNSSALVSNFLTLDAQSSINVNTDIYTPTRYVVHGEALASWTTMHVNPDNEHPGTPSGTVAVPIPPGAFPDPDGTDHQWVIWDVDNATVWEFWACGADENGIINSDGSWSCATAQQFPTDGTFAGVYPQAFDGVFSSTAASRLTYAGGLITVADVLSGSIDHAVSIAVPDPGTNVLPAVSGEGTVTATSIPEGTRYFFPATVAMPSGLAPFAQMVFNAIQTYGMYVIDNSGSLVMYAEHSRPWLDHQGSYPIAAAFDGQISNDVLSGLPWSRLKVLAPQSASSIVAASSGAGAPSGSAFAYQWNRSGAAIAGATSSAYILTAADQDETITCTVTYTTSSGSASATSAATLPVQS